MPIFTFDAVDGKGTNIKKRVIAATDRGDADRKIRSQGMFPTKLQEVISPPARPVADRSITGDVYRVWGVFESLDQTEGRGGTRLVGYFHDKPDAEEAAIGKGVMGGSGEVRAEEMFSTDDGRTGTLFSMNGHAHNIVEPGLAGKRALALAKLSDDDRRVLGL